MGRMKRDVKYICADFETTIGDQKIPPKERETEVWLSCFVDVDKFTDDTAYVVDKNINNFMYNLINYCNKFNGSCDFICFFHNLAFDGSFLVNFLLSKNMGIETFINNMGVWYSITFECDGYKITFRDSLKILNFSIKKMAKLFNTESPKGDTPLLEFRPDEYKDQWIEYVKTDVNILATGIHHMYYKEGFTKFTSSSQALSEIKTMIDYRGYFKLLPVEVDEYLRRAYYGGYVYVNPKFRGYVINEPIDVYDLHSAYPGVMLNHDLPYGKPTFNSGEPDGGYYIANVDIMCDLKEGFLPTFRAKEKNTLLQLGIKKTDYIITTNGCYHNFTLTNFDIDLIKDHYNCDIIFNDYYQFSHKKGIFDDYIKKYKTEKELATANNDDAAAQKPKIMLNGPTGKFASRLQTIQKHVYLEEGILKFEDGEIEESDPNYVALSVFILSINRYNLIREAQKNIDIYIYSDTDSMHLLSDRRKIDIKTHPTKFGEWGIEKSFVKGKYLRPKLYMNEDKDGKLHVKGAGVTDDIKKQVTFENFKFGTEYHGKRVKRQVKGGVILYDTTYKISEHFKL